MSYVDPIIVAFGGVRPLAKAGGWSPSTVKSWKDRGSIPDAHKAEVLRVGQALGLPLRPDHFFPHSIPAQAGTDAPVQGCPPAQAGDGAEAACGAGGPFRPQAEAKADAA